MEVFPPHHCIQTTNTGPTSILLCSHQDSREVSNILKQIWHSCIISIIGRVLRTHGSIQARSTQTISLISHFYILFFFFQDQVQSISRSNPREGRREVRYQNWSDSIIWNCITQSKTHLNKIMDIYLVYLQKTHKEQYSKKSANKENTNKQAYCPCI